jgi:hypothetical protein
VLLVGPRGGRRLSFGLFGVDHVTVYERQTTVRKPCIRLRL